MEIDHAAAEKEFLHLNKQALSLIEVKGREILEIKMLSEFLNSDEIIPKKLNENV